MIKIGDKVVIKNNIEEYVVKEFKNNKSCIIKNETDEIVVFIENLELVQEKIYFTGERIKLKNNLGAIAEIYYEFDDKKKKYICVDIITSIAITGFFNNLDDANLCLKNLGFKELIQQFDLVEFLKENLKPKEFIYEDKNIFLYYDCQTGHVNWDYNETDEIMGTVHFEEIEREKLNSIINEINIQNISPEQLKQAYKNLGWL